MDNPKWFFIFLMFIFGCVFLENISKDFVEIKRIESGNYYTNCVQRTEMK